jgi:hypothetical protein
LAPEYFSFSQFFGAAVLILNPFLKLDVEFSISFK